MKFKYQYGGTFKEYLYAKTNRSPSGVPKEKGLENVYPEMAITGGPKAIANGIFSAITKPDITNKLIDNPYTRMLRRKQDVITHDALRTLWNTTTKMPKPIRIGLRSFLTATKENPQGAITLFNTEK